LFTIGSRLFLGIGTAAFVAGIVYGFDSGWAVFSLVMFLGLAFAAWFLAGVVLAFRDADPEAQAVLSLSSADAEGLGPGGAAAGASPWPVLGALAAALTAFGLVLDERIFVGGIVALLLVTIEWMVQGWAERASGDPAFNRRLRDQLMHPIEFPVVAALIAGVVIFGFSRLMLSVSADAGVWLFIGIATAVLLVAVLLASRPRVGSGVLAGLGLFGAAAILVAGVVGAGVGEREFHHHEPEGVASVSLQSGKVAHIGFDGQQLDVQTINLPKGLFVTVLFDNTTDEEAALVIETGVDSDGNVQEIRTPLREGPAEQALTFRILQPGEYRYYVEGHEEASGTIVVPGTPPATTTEQA